jgi:hypothetical protein
MISSDASNANFASTLVAGGPFVIAVEAEQDVYRRYFLRVLWQAVGHACKCGRFQVNGHVFDNFAELQKLVDINATPPQVAIANKKEEADIDSIDMQNNVLSIQTRRARRGLDNDQEDQNLAKKPLAAGKSTGLDPQKPAGGKGSGLFPVRESASPLASRMADLRARYGDDLAGQIERAARRLLEEKEVERASDGRFGHVAGEHHKKEDGQGDDAGETSKPDIAAKPEKVTPDDHDEKDGATTGGKTASGGPSSVKVERRLAIADDAVRTLATTNLPEEASVEHHTKATKSALSSYTKKGDGPMNQALREGTPAPPAVQKKIAAIQKAYDESPAFPEPVAVWRGIQLAEGEKQQLMEKLKSMAGTGETFALKGFASTSTEPDVARQFGNVMMEIHAKKGLSMEGVTKFGGEKELLLGHNSQFRVVGVKELKYLPYGKSVPITITTIQLEHVL